MKYKLKNLECGNCAAKIERQVAKIKGVEHVAVNFLTQRMTIEAKNIDEIMQEVHRIIKKIDANIEVV